MDIIISNSSNDPIYQQIVNQIKGMIMSGELSPGAALPSMRNLAMQMRVSLITTKRAYEELERDGFIETYTGKGSFVKAQNAEFLREENLRQIEKLMGEAVDKAQMSGVSKEEMKEILDMLFELHVLWKIVYHLQVKIKL